MTQTLRRDPLWDSNGLVPAIVQDIADGRVLMLAWMDAEALRATLETREVHFHSRSRDRLWRKGETSGHVLRLRDVAIDCDADALLVRVEPVGPTCHWGTRSCFDAENPELRAEAPAPEALGTPEAPAPEAPETREAQGFDWLETLWATIASRATHRPAGSYTTSLLDGGVDAVARKVTEEATEVLLAAKHDDAAEASGLDRGPTRDALAGEAADLIYHALVLLAERDVPPVTVIDALRARHDSG